MSLQKYFENISNIGKSELIKQLLNILILILYPAIHITCFNMKCFYVIFFVLLLFLFDQALLTPHFFPQCSAV